jgi:hypothetical protein
VSEDRCWYCDQDCDVSSGEKVVLNRQLPRNDERYLALDPMKRGSTILYDTRTILIPRCKACKWDDKISSAVAAVFFIIFGVLAAYIKLYVFDFFPVSVKHGGEYVLVFVAAGIIGMILGLIINEAVKPLYKKKSAGAQRKAGRTAKDYPPVAELLKKGWKR